MKKALNLTLSLTIAAFMLTACKSESQNVSQYPMVTDELGTGPWQVLTYDDEPIYKESVVLDSGQFTPRKDPVYISRTSQFIFRDGRPIRDLHGNNLYWNSQGYIINRHLIVIPEDQVFSSGGRPLPPGTALKIRGYGQPISLESLSSK